MMEFYKEVMSISVEVIYAIQTMYAFESNEFLTRRRNNA